MRGRAPTKITSAAPEEGSGKGAGTRSTATSYQKVYCQRPACLRRCGTEGTRCRLRSGYQVRDLRTRKSCLGVVVGSYALLLQTAEHSGEVTHRDVLGQLTLLSQPAPRDPVVQRSIRVDPQVGVWARGRRSYESFSVAETESVEHCVVGSADSSSEHCLARPARGGTRRIRTGQHFGRLNQVFPVHLSSRSQGDCSLRASQSAYSLL